MVGILWDKEKERWLKENRGVSLKEVGMRILLEDYIEILDHPNRPEQSYFVMDIKNYIWLIPFLTDEEGTIVIKTAFPSRKYNKIYGRKL